MQRFHAYAFEFLQREVDLRRFSIRLCLLSAADDDMGENFICSLPLTFTRYAYVSIFSAPRYWQMTLIRHDARTLDGSLTASSPDHFDFSPVQLHQLSRLAAIRLPDSMQAIPRHISRLDYSLHAAV